ERARTSPVSAPSPITLVLIMNSAVKRKKSPVAPAPRPRAIIQVTTKASPALTTTPPKVRADSRPIRISARCGAACTSATINPPVHGGAAEHAGAQQQDQALGDAQSVEPDGAADGGHEALQHIGGGLPQRPRGQQHPCQHEVEQH